MRFVQRVCLIGAICASISVPSFAQDDVDQLMQGSVEDARKLIGAYISPFMKSTSLALNQGWYNTAKPHKIAGVDLTITVNAMTVPTSDLMFNVEALNLTEIELDPSSPDYSTRQAPTMLGPDRTPVFRLQNEPLAGSFEGPPGLDLEGNIGSNKVPMPMVHLGFGLPKGTDLKVRFIPTLDFDGTSVKMFGVGVMHDIKQWIPGIKMLPFDLSGFVGYTNFQVNSQLDQEDPNNADQVGSFTMNATTIQGVIGKKFSVLTVYGGLGYNIANSNIALKGKYDINDDGDENDQYETNPVDLSFAASGFRATAGMRLKLAVFTFHADYTVQKYKCLTVGFGISVR